VFCNQGEASSLIARPTRDCRDPWVLTYTSYLWPLLTVDICELVMTRMACHTLTSVNELYEVLNYQHVIKYHLGAVLNILQHLRCEKSLRKNTDTAKLAHCEMIQDEPRQALT
jgi:hypothetical protein